MNSPSGLRAERPRMLVIINPHASTMSARIDRLACSALSSHYDVERAVTEHKGHAIEIAARAVADGVDVVTAFGGDGTVNEVANALVDTPGAMAVIPGGTTNVFSRVLGLSADPLQAVERLLGLADDFSPRAIDLAHVDERWFTFSGSIGLDAAAVARVDRRPALKARYGPYFFAGVGIATFLRDYVPRPPVLHAVAGRRDARGVTVMVQNGPSYTYFRDKPIALVPDGSLESGDLAIAVLNRAQMRDVPSVIWRGVARDGAVADHSRVQAITGERSLTVRSLDGRPVPVQADGEHIGDRTEVTFGVGPGALRILY